MRGNLPRTLAADAPDDHDKDVALPDETVKAKKLTLKDAEFDMERESTDWHILSEPPTYTDHMYNETGRLTVGRVLPWCCGDSQRVHPRGLHVSVRLLLDVPAVVAAEVDGCSPLDDGVLHGWLCGLLPAGLDRYQRVHVVCLDPGSSRETADRR